MSWNRTTISITLFALVVVVTMPFLNLAHLFDWDEVNFAEAAREMLVTGQYGYVQIDFKPFWEKPPLFIWMQALSMKVFGVNELAARFPNVICSGLTLVVLYNIGKSLHSTRFGLLWTLVYAGSILPQFYFRSGIIDPWFNLFIFLGIHQLIKASSLKEIKSWPVFLSAVLIGLAVITKGPTALALVAVCSLVYFILKFKSHDWKFSHLFIYASTVLVVGFSWFLVELARGHGYVIQEFIDYHIRLLAKGEAGHAQPFYYHAIVLLFGCFPMSLFFIFRWFNKVEEAPELAHYAKWMSILFWVVFTVFSIVKTKIIHYSSLTYLPMSFLAATSIFQLQNGNWKFRIGHQIALLVFIAALGGAFVLLGMMETIKEPLLQAVSGNQLAYGNFSQQIPDKWFEPLIGLFFLFATMGSVVLIQLGRTRTGTVGLFGSTFITVMLLVIVAGPKIDQYTQAPLMNFYKEKSGKAYLQPLGFHSYAHLFYGKKEPNRQQHDDEVMWLIKGEVDKPVYFILRPQNLEAHQKWFKNLEVTDKKAGYLILERTDEAYPFLGEP